MPLVTTVVALLRTLNDRHPWSHNDHFHAWIVRSLPVRRRVAVDLGCGRGELVARLAPHFERVVGIDLDEGMRAAASRRTRGVRNATITAPGEGAAGLAGLVGPIDLVTMIAVLHHLHPEPALRAIADRLEPGGRLLVVGLAPPRSLRDLAWDLLSAATNPLIGLVKHPRPAVGRRRPDAFPVRDPELSFDDLHAIVRRTLPGARMRHRLAFRHTICWTKPGA